MRPLAIKEMQERMQASMGVVDLIPKIERFSVEPCVLRV